MKDADRKTIHREDYKPSNYLIDEVELRFELGEDVTTVRAELNIRRAEGAGESPLVLDGKGLTLVSVALDGRALGDGDYQTDDDTLTIAAPPAAFSLRIVTEIKPQENTLLEGLYKSSGNFCTQCEAEGFRRITYFLDRPDIMARYTTTIVADKARYPVLLSNGNEVETGVLDDGRHWSKWVDPFPKPSYLFALVAGDLDHIEDHFTTASGRDVRLRIYAIEDDIGKCAFAMESLKNAMAWDERVFGLEYDLDLYNIVAVRDFNMGAMENKGLNIFNTQLVLAGRETATDDDFARVESVIGHEYFHNWTGNRITCRDWFQLSLKEGLTVFRDQQFSTDMRASSVRRIEDVRHLRARQFLEDAGPMAHPIRPESYIEINNFYTGTVYDKGAEVIRMMHTLLGPDGFRNGMDLYVERHDGEAATCDDFTAAMEDATGVDLGQFRLWYSQAGTPQLKARGDFDARSGIYSLTVEQTCPPTPGQDSKAPMHIPLAVGLLDHDGNDMPLVLQGERAPFEPPRTRVLNLRKAREEFRFAGLEREPAPSLLRGFSAPVKLDASPPLCRFAFLMSHDNDPFARWEAGQTLAVQVIMRLVDDHRNGIELRPDPEFIDAIAKLLADGGLDPAFRAEMLILPTEGYLAQMMPQIDPEAIHVARSAVRKRIADAFESEFSALYRACRTNEPYDFSAGSVARRRLKNACLSYLMHGGGDGALDLCMTQFRDADNMTDELAALMALSHSEETERDQALETFFDRWKDDPLVVDKWFAVQAISERADTIERVGTLTRHEAFDIRNPNKVRALIGAFSASNQVRFHDASGAGYRFFTDQILMLDTLNPRVAARLIGVFERWRQFEPGRRMMMKAELERILGQPKLSRDVYEIVSKSLA
ncbi:MAG: aminopeptidase N [Sphingomonadales bacterium]